MQLEDYFNVLASDDIRIQGSRIGIESVLLEYLHRARTPEQIVERFPTLRLDQVYATILYYLQNKERVEAYLEGYLEYCWKSREDFFKNPPPYVEKLRQLKAERQEMRRRVEADIV